MLIPVCVDYSQPFGQSDQDAWEAEYQANIKKVVMSRGLVFDDEYSKAPEASELGDYSLPEDILEQLQMMEPVERQAVLDELAVQSDIWSGYEEEGGFYE